jgi:hypothetical protein
LTPVLSDNNKNLLHHFAIQNNLLQLEAVFKNCDFDKLSKFINREQKLFPFFLDFDGESAMDYAISQKLSHTFYLLVEKLIQL